MAEPAKDPFALMLEQFREIVREEIAAALRVAGNGVGRERRLLAGPRMQFGKPQSQLAGAANLFAR